MGADEKHAATYHGGEYTPLLSHVRAAYARSYRSAVGLEEAEAQFTRWLNQIRAEAWAEGHAAGEGSVKAKDNPYKEIQ